MPDHPNWFLILFHIARTSCSGLPNLPATTFHENRDSSSDLRVRSILLSSSVQVVGGLGERIGDNEDFRRRFPGAFGVAFVGRFCDGVEDAIENFGGAGMASGTGASTCW